MAAISCSCWGPVLPSDVVAKLHRAQVSLFTSEHPHLSVIYVTVTETLSNLGATPVLPHSSYGIGCIPAGWWQTPVCGALSWQHPKDVEHLPPFSSAIARSGHRFDRKKSQRGWIAGLKHADAKLDSVPPDVIDYSQRSKLLQHNISEDLSFAPKTGFNPSGLL